MLSTSLLRGLPSMWWRSLGGASHRSQRSGSGNHRRANPCPDFGLSVRGPNVRPVRDALILARVSADSVTPYLEFR